MSDSEKVSTKRNADPQRDSQRTAEQVNKELNAAMEEFNTAQERVRGLRAELRFLQGNPREAVRFYRYQVNLVALKELFDNGIAIHGTNDLFKRVLTLIDDETEVKINPADIQISARIRKEGMKALEKHCSIQRESPRKFYIRFVKNMDIRKVDDTRTLKREAAKSELRNKIAQNESATNNLINRL